MEKYNGQIEEELAKETGREYVVRTPNGKDKEVRLLTRENSPITLSFASFFFGFLTMFFLMFDTIGPALIRVLTMFQFGLTMLAIITYVMRLITKKTIKCDAYLFSVVAAVVLLIGMMIPLGTILILGVAI